MKKLFTNDKFFLTMVICAVVGEVLFGAFYLCIMPSLFPMFVTVFLSAAFALLLYISYRKHSKNVMKALMGAILMAEVSQAINSITGFGASFDGIMAFIQLVLAVLLLINHLIINSDRHSDRSNIMFNQLIVVLLAILVIVWDVMWITLAESTVDYFINIFDIIGHPCMMAVVVCVESRLDAYRLEREAAGWTEEKGYPEGYVHEYEKNS